MCKIENARDAEDKREADRKQSIYGADDSTVYEDVQQGGAP
jgi:hypothetical protein